VANGYRGLSKKSEKAVVIREMGMSKLFKVLFKEFYRVDGGERERERKKEIPMQINARHHKEPTTAFCGGSMGGRKGRSPQKRKTCSPPAACRHKWRWGMDGIRQIKVNNSSFLFFRGLGRLLSKLDL
jgi:hypothetical protein